MKLNAKKSLVLLPGLVCDGFVWHNQVRALSDEADCLAIEWGAEASLPAMAETALRQAPEQFAVAGHSMGGRVALEIHRLAPHRVAGISLLNTGYLPLPPGEAGREEERGRMTLLNVARTEGMRTMAKQWLPPMIHPARHNDQVLVDSIVEMFARKTPSQFEAQLRALLARPDATGVLDQIRCPALLLTGQADGWSPPARHAEMAARIPGATLIIVPDCGHMSTLEQPEAVSNAFRAWLGHIPVTTR